MSEHEAVAELWTSMDNIPILAADGQHAITVQRYLFGQYRIQILDQERASAFEPLGAIVREMCTYREDVATDVIARLSGSEKPLAVAESFARPWNCEYPGGRIRLDNEPSNLPGGVET